MLGPYNLLNSTGGSTNLEGRNLIDPTKKIKPFYLKLNPNS